MSFENNFAFWQDVGKVFAPIYVSLMNKNKSKKYTPEQKQWQLLRRGRNVEFNLVYDRGTIFGLQTNGRTESILMSLPPLVRWEYCYQPAPNTPEAKLYDVFLKPQDWVNWQG